VPSTFRYVVVDVFTDTPLAGNQLAVFTDARELPEELLQPLAREMNFSEARRLQGTSLKTTQSG
jgi:trans-2,3-dihydro-3-hydroxyanthranilate isomerase